MSVLIKLLRDSYDLQESKGDKPAYWHLQKLREAIKNDQIKVESLPIDSVSNRRELLVCKECNGKIDELDAWCKHCGEVIY